jgi:hypothetical protein
VSEPDDPYARGHAAGEIGARLASHDKHFAAINGSIGDLRDEMHSLTLAVQRLGDQAMAREATVLVTAAALKDSEEARRIGEVAERDKSEQSWSPWTRVFAVLAAIATAVGLYVLLVDPH